MSFTKENREKSQKIVDAIIDKLDNSNLLFKLIKDDFRDGFYRELLFDNNDYFLQIGFSLNPLDYPNTFDVRYQNKIKADNVINKYILLHELITIEPMDLYLYSERSLENLISYIQLVDKSKYEFFR